jgi:hypothetical protein
MNRNQDNGHDYHEEGGKRRTRIRIFGVEQSCPSKIRDAYRVLLLPTSPSWWRRTEVALRELLKSQHVVSPQYIPGAAPAVLLIYLVIFTVRDGACMPCVLSP